MEAELARVKLESEGILSFMADRELGSANLMFAGRVRLQVHEADVDLAEEILERVDEDASPDEYVDEAWRCPKCHRKSIELLPLEGWRRALRVLFAVCALLAVAGIVLCALTDDTRQPWRPLVVVFVAAALVLGLSLAVAHRRKRCTNCGSVW